jgi:hypothetical protein
MQLKGKKYCARNELKILHIKKAGDDKTISQIRITVR